MTTIRRIVTSKIDGDNANNTNSSEIRPFGETAFYLDTNVNPSKLVLMMFDGQRTHRQSKVLSPGVLWGSNADGGGGGPTLDTIKLIPDAGLYADANNDYHVVVDVVGEGQISLRAGGPVNSSSVDILLGGPQNHVSVSDSNDRVEIRTSQSGEGVISRTWWFDNSGHITFPDNTVQTTAYTGGADTLDTVTDRGATTTNSITVGSVITTDITNNVSSAVGTRLTGIRPPDGAGNNLGYVWVPDVTELSSLGDISGWTMANSDGIFSTTIVQMRYDLGAAWAIQTADPLIFTGTYTFTSPNYAPPAMLPVDINVGTSTWTFGTTSTLTLPGGGTITEGIVTDNPTIQLTPATPDDPSQKLVIKGGGAVDYHLHLTTGQLTQTSIFLGTDDHHVRTSTDGGVQIRSYNYGTSTPKVWNFGANGILSVPEGIKNTQSLGGSVSIATASEQGDPAKTWTVTHDGAGKLIVPEASSVVSLRSFNVLTHDSEFTNFVNLKDFDSLSDVNGTAINIINPQANMLPLIDPTSPTFAGGVGVKVRIAYGFNVTDKQVIETTLTGAFALNGEDPLLPGIPRYTAYIAENLGGALEIREFGIGQTANWNFKSNGTLQLPAGMTIETSYGGNPRLVVDGKSRIVDLRSNDRILIGYNGGSGNVYIGGNNGQVDIVGPKFRVLAEVPATSAGKTGDQAGQVAFDGSYIYFCTQNFSGTTYTVVHSVAEGFSADGVNSGYLVSNTYQLPQVGWKVYYNDQVRTIDQVNNSGISGFYVVFVDSELVIPGGATFAWGPASAGNIWKRVAWSADTW